MKYVKTTEMKEGGFYIRMYNCTLGYKEGRTLHRVDVFLCGEVLGFSPIAFRVDKPYLKRWISLYNTLEGGVEYINNVKPPINDRLQSHKESSFYELTEEEALLFFATEAL